MAKNCRKLPASNASDILHLGQVDPANNSIILV